MAAFSGTEVGWEGREGAGAEVWCGKTKTKTKMLWGRTVAVSQQQREGSYCHRTVY